MGRNGGVEQSKTRASMGRSVGAFNRGKGPDIINNNYTIICRYGVSRSIV